MFKNASSRTKTMLNACLQHPEDEDKNDRDDIIIEGTPENSPKKSKKSLPVAGAKPLLSGNGCSNQASTTNSIKKPDENNIESIPYFALPPKPPISQTSYIKASETITIIEDIGEKSIEAPPYSPLTPRPQTLPNKLHTQVDAPPNEIIEENSIESPWPLLLSPKPHCSRKEIISNSRSSSSPLRPMTPETTELLNILAESLDNEEFITHGNKKVAPSSPFSSDITDILNSDDSVQDPDYIDSHNRNDKTSDESSSDNSVSLLTTTLQVHHAPNEGSDHNSTSQILQETVAVAQGSSQGRPKKGRKRLYGGLVREDRKKRKYNNLSYVNSKKQTIDSKVFIDYNCNCVKKCQEKISTEEKLAEFNKFYSFGSYVAQNMYLIACVKEKPKKRAYVTTTVKQKNRTYSREYYLKDILVCKQMFLNTLQTSSKRVNTALCKMRNNCLKDKRGKTISSTNAASTESELFLENIIKKLPTYVSHYRRATTNDTKFLTSDMTLSKIYDLYSEEAKLAGQKLLSHSKVRHVFVTKFNLRIKPLKKDTCNKCDFYESKTRQASGEEKRKLEEDHTKHIEKAKFLQQALKSDMELAKNDPMIETITFDLQKTLPLPRIPTNIVFYKRQLWVYNLGIHTGSDDQAYCNVWVEGEAGRGAQEVGSCLIKHITEKLKDGVKYLVLWSDSCGGQNRNIKLTLMLKALLNEHPTLEKISHRFLESGHSFLPNDTDFGRIECALKHQQRLYIPEDYIEIMKKCRKIKPMIVQRLTKEDFLSSNNLEKKITNRKKAEDGSKISWLNTKEIMLKKENKYSIFMRNNLDEPFLEVNLKKNVRSVTPLPLSRSDMDLLWPTGKPISEAKLNDLKSMIHLIPKDAQAFYKKIKSSEAVEDDIDGYTGPVDFEVEINDNVDV